jgi:ribonuclease BN (tRNA processing enzyme)
MNQDHLILLGTGGGPRIWSARSQPESALIIKNNVYVIDAGDGVATQMAKSKIDPESIKAIFITHNHSDHVADFGTLLLRTWQSGHNGFIQCFGPPPVKQMIKSYMDYMQWDIKLRIKEENRPKFDSIFNVNEINSNSFVYKDNNLSVDCIKVPHGTAKPSYAYRFKIGDKRIVFSGDTSKSVKLIKFAKNSDYLIHEVLNIEGVDAIIERTYPGNKAFRRHIIEAHTTMEEVGEIATKANVKTLILNHLVPTGSPTLDKSEIWRAGVSKNFKGKIIVGSDLLKISI